MRMPRLLMIGLVASIALGGCARSTAELNEYIDQVKARPGKPLDPLPVMKTFETFEYAAHTLRDPFTGPDSQQNADRDIAGVSSGGGPAPDRNRRKEELESFPLDSLDMVGTLGSGADIFGLVKDPAGVVHRVKPNNYLGQNDGRITAVFEDRIELTELFPNGLGGWEERKSKVALDDE